MQLITDPNFISYLQRIGVDVIDGVAQNADKVKELLIAYRGIKSLDGIGQFRNLRELSCTYNNLTALDISDCKKLERLYCHNNGLTTLDVSWCGVLRELYCRDNKLTSLDLRGCKELEFLSCMWNDLTSLDLGGCGRLGVLNCDYNNLTTLDVSGCGSLRELHCSDNPLPLWQSCASGIFFKNPNGRICLLRPDGIVHAGCFRGTLEEFEKAALDKYGDDEAKNYQHEIKRLKELINQIKSCN